MNAIVGDTKTVRARDAVGSTAEDQSPLELMREAVEASGTGVWCWDATADTLQYSHEWAHMIGYDSEELSADLQAWETLVHPDDLGRFRSRIRDHFSEGVPFVCEYRLKTRPGNYRWFRAVGGRRSLSRPENQQLIGLQFDIHTLVEKSRQILDDGFIGFPDLPVGLAEVGLDGRWLSVNDSLCKLLGYSRDELLQKSFQDITHPADLEADMAHVRRLVDSGPQPVRFADGQIDRYQLHKRYVNRAGNEVPLLLDVTLVRDEYGLPQKFASSLQDIADTFQQEVLLAQEQHMAEVTLSSIADGVVRIDRRGIISFANRAACNALQRPPHEVLQQPAEVLLLLDDPANPGPDLLARSLETVLQLAESLQFSSETSLRTPDGRRLAVECSLAPVRGPRGEVQEAVFVFHDSTEARQLTAALAHQASHDALTGLANRRQFASWLEEVAIAYERHDGPASLLYLDLDNFKQVNDTYGHHIGDRALQSFARGLQGILPSTALIARMGGDEFAVLMPDTNRSQAHGAAIAALSALQKVRQELDLDNVALSASIGIASLDAERPEAETAMISADLAALVAKSNGGGRAEFYEDVEGAITSGRSLALWRPVIESLLAEKRLLLYGQKIVDPTGSVLGYEILLRYRDTEGLIHTPQTMIWAAEQLGWATRIDGYVLDAVENMGISGRIPHGCHLALNICGKSLCDSKFQQRAREFCERMRPVGCELVFEITETSSLHDLSAAASFIGSLRADYGVAFALDDFGTGYASFSYLKHIPVQTVKLSRSYVQDLDRNPLNQLIVRSVASIAGLLNLSVVAEGVETAQELGALWELGIARFQGWLFHQAEPLPWA